MSDSRKDGGQAFPDEVDEGMSLRDYFAAKAMQVWTPIVVNAFDGCTDIEPTSEVMSAALEAICEQSYRHADAMLAEREKGGEE